MIYNKMPKVTKKERRLYNIIIGETCNVYATSLKEANRMVLNALKGGDKTRMQIRIEDVYLHDGESCFSVSAPFKSFNW